MPKTSSMRRLLPLACAVWILAVFLAVPRAAQVTTETAEGGAGKTRGDGHCWKVHLRQAIDAQLAEGERPDHNQREDQNRRENRPTDAEFS